MQRRTPAAASTAMIASGPYATEVRASRDSADSPSTGVICSLVTSRARSGGPTSTCQSARIRMGRLRVRVLMLNGTCIAAKRIPGRSRPA